MSQLAFLKAATTLTNVAPLLNYKASGLSYVLYKIPDVAKYEVFDIPKRNGGSRRIHAPTPQLKGLQTQLSILLQNCLEEINAEEGRTNSFSNGFTRGRSILHNATAHQGKRFVFNIDLHNFFGAINFGRVRGFFIKDRNFLLHPKVATILAQIACFDNALPQGSPCSPVISNLIGHILDIHLVKLAIKFGCIYSRYADDITFSTNKLEFPGAIAVNNNHIWRPGTELEHLISLCGFGVNPTKTRMQYRDSRQEVTGLIVNKKVNPRSEYRRSVRAMVHRLFTTGSFELQEAQDDGTGVKALASVKGELSQLHGMLGFIDSVDIFNKMRRLKSLSPKERERQAKLQAARELSSKESMFRTFLFYREFFVSTMPVIVCEGKTDNIYLKHAINALAMAHPTLAAVDANGAVERKIRIYRYADTSTGRILGITGGGPPLAQFVERYAKTVGKFKASGGKHPLILLLDNDSGANAVVSTVKQVSGVKMTRLEPFVHVAENLYVALTPLSPGVPESEMEDFFDAGTKATLVGGKSFDQGSNLNTSTHYGKHVFAQKVVASSPQSIDFGGFQKMLTNISALIQAHSTP